MTVSLFDERSFFGVLTVAHDPEGTFTQLYHGTTLHGQQYVDPARRDEPSAYYHPGGAISQVFQAFSGPSAKERVAVIGLGTGTLAIFAEPGQKMTYYEIDPAVLRIASDPRWFTYLRDSPADVDVVLGDARLRLVEAPPGRYGMLVLLFPDQWAVAYFQKNNPSVKLLSEPPSIRQSAAAAG